MGSIVRLEFMGSWLFVVILCLTVVGIPLAVVYMTYYTVIVIESLPNPSDFVEKWKARRVAP
jgi:hypothetical protein